MAAYGKMTVLDMVQDILSSMDSDEVNSISDTVESWQVANAVKTTYYEIIGGLDVPSLQRLQKLDACLDPSRPNYLKIPENVKNFEWIKYDYRTNDQPDYRVLVYLEPEEFVWELEKRNNLTTNITVVDDYSGARLQIFNNQMPYYWTSFDNDHICFDGFDNTKEATLEQTFSLTLAQVLPEFRLEDSFVPSLDGDSFPLLLAEAKSYCWTNYKQQPNGKEEQKAKRQRIRGMNDRWRANQRMYDRYPNYGRKPGSSNGMTPGRGGVRTYGDLT